ncbi:hypothetical protein [Larkinella knui]|nr:hypothetical protein [Larkinella knui]
MGRHRSALRDGPGGAYMLLPKFASNVITLLQEYRAEANKMKKWGEVG